MGYFLQSIADETEENIGNMDSPGYLMSSPYVPENIKILNEKELEKLIELHEKGVISSQTLFDGAGIDYKKEVEQLQLEKTIFSTDNKEIEDLIKVKLEELKWKSGEITKEDVEHVFEVAEKEIKNKQVQIKENKSIQPISQIKPCTIIIDNYSIFDALEI
ncbi:MAG: hypothetical protein AABY32_02445 [Nanoarchaeota archaeon]